MGLAGDLTLDDQRGAFHVDDGVAYFNTAAISPLLRGVRDAGDAAVAQRAQPWTITERDWFEGVDELRRRAAAVMGTDPRNVGLVPSSSYGLATVARNLHAHPGQRVLVLQDEFPSSYNTWRRFSERSGAQLVLVEREPGQSWADAVVAAVEERTAVAVLPNVHWTNGARVDLARVAPLLHDVGASLVIDASQSLGAMPLDLDVLRPDAMVAVGYKWLLGPMSLGYLYVDARLQEGEPLEENWISRSGSEDFSALVDVLARYRPGAERFDVGERSNFILTPMAAAALQQVLAWTVPRISATLAQRTAQIRDGAERLGLSVLSANEGAPHIVGVQLPRESARHIAAVLAERSVVASVRGASLRIAPHLHNSDGDVDRLLSALGAAL